MARQLEGMTVAILVTQGFEQVELTSPREALDEAGATSHIVSPQSGSIKAWDMKDWGETFEVDVTLDEANPTDYDALLLPGGVLSPDKLRMNEKAVQFVKAFFEDRRPVAAICHGPWTLIEAGVVEGCTMTSYQSLRTDLINAGADWKDKEVVTDGNLVTSRNPDDLPTFNEAMIALFAKGKPEAVGS